MFYYTYVIKSLKDHKRYIGWTNDLKKRINSHNESKVIATASRIPFELEYYEACTSKEKAIEREKYFKSGFGRRFLNDRL